MAIMSNSTTDVQAEYQRRIDAMTPAERVARGVAMFEMTRQAIARELLKERGPMSDAEVRWRVAMKLYGDENETIRRLIQEQIDRVSN